MSADIELARTNMVENQVRTWDVLDLRVLDVLGRVRREDFVPLRYRAMAFADLSLPIGHDEVMMKPVVEGRLLQAVEPQPHEHVLEIGTGSGFVTACLAALAGQVVSVEQHADLSDAAAARLDAAGVRNVRLAVADAMRGYEPDGSFDAVVVTGAVYTIPDRFRAWVKPGGRLFAIVGESPAMQAVLLTRLDADRWHEESLFETDVPYLTHAAPPRRFTL